MLDILLLILAGLLVWLGLKNRELAQHLRSQAYENAILRDHLDAERKRNNDLLNCNYELALLNEDLFAALHKRTPLTSLLGNTVIYTN